MSYNNFKKSNSSRNDRPAGRNDRPNGQFSRSPRRGTPSNTTNPGTSSAAPVNFGQDTTLNISRQQSTRPTYGRSTGPSNDNRRSNDSRPPRDGQRDSQPRSYGYSSGYSARPAMGGAGSRRRYVNPGLKIDVNRFVNRAQPSTQEKPYEPQHRFIDFAIENQLKQNIVSKNYIHPTAIQDQTIPHILENKDVIGIANTGTGKTAAFLIPLINKIILNRKERVLIMVPTRELALQIQDELYSFTKGMGIRSAFCIGGANIKNQIYNLRHDPSFIIGTPGRLKDLIERNALRLGDVKNVVLDEADRMLDMGFINDMKQILSLLPTPRQTLLFSATLSREIEVLTHQFQTNPVKVSVKTRESSANVDQDIVRITDPTTKVDVLHDLLIKPDFEKVLIFGETKHGVEKLSKMLDERGFKSASIHGNKTQSARQIALRKFKDHEIKILVATDVAARGLDIPNVSHVINYDVPSSYEDYVHRIGRTGRAGNTGKALTFVG